MVGRLDFKNKLVGWLWLLALVPPAVVVLTELNKTVLIWHIRIVDFIDLVVLAPFYLVTFLSVQALVFRQRQGFTFWLALGLIGLFLYGHAMHLTGNAINTFSTEVHDYRSQIPVDTYQLIYFFDEDLGHWLIFTGLYGLMGLWLLEDEHNDPRIWLSAIPGFLVGLFQAVAVIESSHPWLAILFLLILTGSLILRSRLRGERMITIWLSRPLARFVMTGLLAMLVGELVYFVGMGGFIQPSQLGY